MCGIFGTVFRDPQRRAQEARVVAARDSLTHRGPDEAGLWSLPGVALAHRRLKVLDLTHGQQPVVSPDQRFAMVYNGEVYNFQDLRDHYSKLGARFETRCDTEVVFEALNREGTPAIDQFNGMFALAHWDHQARTLLLVRDRLGKKPLYWYADDQQLVFASELKAILEYLGRRFDVDGAALDSYFARGYVPAPRTIFRDIHKLPAGCLLRVDARQESWSWKLERYWDFTPREVPTEPSEVLDELDDLLTDAVRMRLVSDVPIGCLLSGGIDSSLITALAAKVSAEPVKAFSIGFDETPEHNELPYAQMVAKRHGCRWFNRTVRGGDFMANLNDVAPFLDEPYGNFTVFSMRKLAQLAREQLVVVLSGQGGDELGAGYPGRYNWVLPEPPANEASRYAPAVDDLVQHLNHRSFVPWTGARDAILSPGLQAAIQEQITPADDLLPFWGRHKELGRLNNLLYADVKTNLSDYLICLEERMTMSCSLEARNPLLDSRVVDFLLSLPATLKARDGKNKWVLMELARRYVPAETIDRPKRGFTPPLELWMNQNSAAIAGEFAATATQTRGLYSPAWEKFLLQGKITGATMMPAYYSLMLAQWVKRFGQYIGSWPTEGGGSSGVSPRTSAQSPWQKALRSQDPAMLAESRWFCQALGNFPAGTPLTITGDTEGWYTFLAKGSGAVISKLDAVLAANTGRVFVGMETLQDLAQNPPSTIEAGVTILIFASFAMSETARAQQLLQSITGQFTIKGYHAAPLSQNRALLVARCEAAVPAAAA